MPLIKDKDRYKKLSRRENKLVGKPQNPVNKITNKTLRDKEEASDKRKSEAILKSQEQPNVNVTITKSVADTGGNVIALLTLGRGESLINIVITNTTGGALNYDLHWSFTSRNQLTFTTSAGLITGVTGGETACLSKAALASNTTVSLTESLNIKNMFSNIQVPIYFYIMSRDAGIDITCSTSS